MATRRIKGWWYTDFRVGGVRYRKRSPENARAGAQAYELVLRQRLARGEDIKHRPPEEKPLTFAEFAKEWMETYVKANNKPSEIAMKESILRVHLLPVFGDQAVGSITEAGIERYKADKRHDGLSPKTINNQLTVLRKALSCAQEARLVDRVPSIHWLKYMPPQVRTLDAASCDALLAATQRERDHAMILLALTAGLRVGEILGLHGEDVDLDAACITIRHNLVEGVLGTPKSNRTRVVPLTDELQRVIAARKVSRRADASPFVFTSPDGRPLSRDQANWILWRACDRAGLPRVGWHRLRHSVGTLLHLRGAPLRAIQDLLGHSTSRMTERYTHVSASALRQVVGLLPWTDSVVKRGQQLGSGALAAPPAGVPRADCVDGICAQQSENDTASAMPSPW
jgi:integrase